MFVMWVLVMKGRVGVSGNELPKKCMFPDTGGLSAAFTRVPPPNGEDFFGKEALGKGLRWPAHY